MIEYRQMRVTGSTAHVFYINQYPSSPTPARIELLTTPDNQLWIPGKFYEKSNKPNLLVNGSIFNNSSGQAYGENMNFSELRPVIRMNKHGNLTMGLEKDPMKQWAMEVDPAWALMSYGQLLNAKGEVEIVRKADHFRNPRTLAGVLADGRFVLVCVQGRKAGELGISITESANLMKSLGCVRGAHNLDGGGSTQVFYNGRLLFVPSDGRQRPVANMFGVYC